MWRTLGLKVDCNVVRKHSSVVWKINGVYVVFNARNIRLLCGRSKGWWWIIVGLRPFINCVKDQSFFPFDYNVKNICLLCERSKGWMWNIMGLRTFVNYKRSDVFLFDNNVKNMCLLCERSKSWKWIVMLSQSFIHCEKYQCVRGGL